MFAKIVLACEILFAVTERLEAASACAPSCESASEFEQVSVPWDCTMYSTCGYLHGDGELWPSDPSSCSAGSFFEPGGLLSSGSCQLYPTGADEFCFNTCNPCNAYYSHSGDTTPHPTECGSFYLNAEDNVLIQVDCAAETPYYDYRNGQCQTDPSRCYNFCDPCKYYCIGETNVPDPYDCTSFYQCNPPSSAHFTCPADEIFDQQTEVCSATATCVQECA